MQTPDTVTTEDLFMFTSYFATLDKVRHRFAAGISLSL